MPKNNPGQISRRNLLGGAIGIPLLSLTGRSRPASADAGEPQPGKWNLKGEGPHLVVHYMPWFAITKSQKSDKVIWDHWKWTGEHAPHDPEKRRADGLRDIDSVYYPLIGPYNTWSPAVIRYHMETIQAMGGSAVVVDWSGPGSYSDEQMAQILGEAHRAGLKATLCYEEKINFVWPALRDPKTRAEAVDAAAKDLQYILDKYAKHPAFLRRDGQPFFIQFNGYGQGKLGPRLFTPEEYQEITHRLSEPVALGRQGLEPGYATSAACRFLWFSSNREAMPKFAAAARDMIAKRQMQFFMAFICPGFDDTGVWGWNNKPRVTPRHGLAFLDETFNNAFVGNPELIQLVTWNDFQEGTVFEPTREFGFHYIDALATWWARKKDRTIDLAALRKPFLTYAATCSAAEKAELPPAPWDTLLAPRPLTVDTIV